jgi:hypothetical protein
MPEPQGEYTPNVAIRGGANGRALLSAPELPRAALDERLRQAWLGSARFTCTQLATGFLVRASRQPAAPFTLTELTDHLHAEAAALAAEGRHVDRRLLHPPAARRLASRYMAFVARRGFVRRAGRDAWMPLPLDLTLQVAPNDVGYPAAPVAYAWNELSEMLSASALTETPGEQPARYASE